MADSLTDDREQHRQAIREVAGSLTGIWPPGWREELKDEWPE